MIVRISGEDQYRLPDHDGRVEELDDAVIAAVRSGEEAAFRDSYRALLEYVRAGERVADADLEPSDLILPPADLSLAEAQEEFSGEGLIPE